MTGVLAAVAVVLLTVVVRQLLPGGTQTFQLLRRHRLTAEADRDIGDAREYHVALAAENGNGLDERTWRDLDLDDLFLTLDRTTSRVGRQFLYRLLKTPRDDGAELQRLDAAANAFAADADLAGRVRGFLEPLSDARSARLVNLMFGELPSKPAIAWVFPVLSVASVAFLVAIPAWPRAFIGWILICATNLVVQIAYKPRVKQFIPAIHELPKFVRAAAELGGIDEPTLAHVTRDLPANAKRLSFIRRASLWLMFEPGQANELATSLYEYVNIAFLLDVNAFAFAISALEELRPTMRATFEAIGYLDAAQSIAAWRSDLEHWCTPESIAREKTLEAEGIYHPLLDAPIANTIAIDGHGVLITGSNMSGKTTFVRTLGVNAVLAQTMYTVCARRWRAPRLAVRTSIGRTDSILEGKSYYLAEAESVRSLVAARDDGAQHLFLLDEIFRGTNTPERIAAGYAVLAYLAASDDLVAVATHDVELIALLGDTYASYHFREEVDANANANAITFDHRLRAGPSSTTNAIALLGLLGYPTELVAAARAQLGH